jgi:zeta-carotene desaturase
VLKLIEFHDRFTFIEPGGRRSEMQAGGLPPPLHFAGSFAKLRFLGFQDKLAVARGLLAIRRERTVRTDLDRLSMLEWLNQHEQTELAIERFWRPILVSAINVELDRMAASHGFQVLWLGFLATRDGYQMGVSRVPLGNLYSEANWRTMPGVRFRFRKTVTEVKTADGLIQSVEADGEQIRGDHYISALQADRLAFLIPQLSIQWDEFVPSPITGVHLWFDRPVTDLPHGALLDRTIHWFFNKRDGRYIQLVVSASHSLDSMRKQDVIDLAVRELAEFLPTVSEARLVDSHVVKEMKATFAARPGLERYRPGPATAFENLSLAGDWTRSGWPATMEGAVRSGYLAAEHASAALGSPQRFLFPDIA